MRYFLDTEYNGFGGALISLALAPEHGDQEFYATLPLPEPLHPWVERNVVPYLHNTPMGAEHCDTREIAADRLAEYLRFDPEPLIVADWPEDIAHFCWLLTTGPGEMAAVASVRFHLVRTLGFCTSANSSVPHNALHDARALRTYLMDNDHA